MTTHSSLAGNGDEITTDVHERVKEPVSILLGKTTPPTSLVRFFPRARVEHPVVLGSGNPYFHRPRPRLHCAGCEQIDEDVVRLTYVPA